MLNPKFSIITRLMFGTNYSTLHYNLFDSAGNSMVIEYSGEKNLQVCMLHASKLSALGMQAAQRLSVQAAPLEERHIYLILTTI